MPKLASKLAAAPSTPPARIQMAILAQGVWLKPFSSKFVAFSHAWRRRGLCGARSCVFVVAEIIGRIALLVLVRCCALSCVSKPLRIEFAEVKRDTTTLVKGSSIETFVSQTQQDQLYSGLPNLTGRKENKRPSPYLTSWLILVTVQAGTPSLHDEDDDRTPGHVSKSIKLGSEGDVLPQECPKRVDSDAKAPEGSSAEIMAVLAGFSNSMIEVKGTVDCFRNEMTGNAKSLEDNMNEGFKTEGIERKTDHE